MIIHHIYPEFSSPLAFLRCKACLVFSKFSGIKFKNQQLFEECLKKVFLCMTDSQSLAVKLFAGITLRETVQNPIAQPIVLNNLENLFNSNFPCSHCCED